jgi:5-methylcytosine-specific restriction endonuclease McrA
MSELAPVQNSRALRRGQCPCCGREVALTFHHLIPRKVHRRPRFRKNFDRELLNRGMFLCRRCHNGIHKRYDEMTLARDFSTPEALLTDPDLQRHFNWVAKQRERSG